MLGRVGIGGSPLGRVGIGGSQCEGGLELVGLSVREGWNWWVSVLGRVGIGGSPLGRVGIGGSQC